MVVLMRAGWQGRRSLSNMSTLVTPRGVDVMLRPAAFNETALAVGLPDR